MTHKRYGGRLLISPHIIEKALRDGLGLQGDLMYIESDPMTRAFVLYMEGEEGQYPLLEEGMKSPELGAVMHRCECGKITLEKIVDYKTGEEYIHSKKEGGCDEESNKKEKCNCKAEGDRNYCDKHPGGVCPRQKGDCANCQFDK